MISWVLAHCGFGGARLGLALEESEHPRGSTAHGIVALTGGRVPQHVERLTIRLVRVALPGHKEISRRTVRLPGPVAAHSREEIPFAVEVPDDLALSKTGNTSSLSYVEAVASIPRPFLTSVFCYLNVVQHREETAVRQAMVALGFREKPGKGLGGLADSFAEGYSNADIYHYLPPESLRTHFREARLVLSVNAYAVVGNLYFRRGRSGAIIDFDVSDSGKGGHFSIGAGPETGPLTFRIVRGDLRDREGGPRPDVAAENLNQLLDRVLQSIDPARSTLLRASDSPDVSHEELMRPAMPGAVSSEADLLRAAEPESSNGST